MQRVEDLMKTVEARELLRQFQRFAKSKGFSGGTSYDVATENTKLAISSDDVQFTLDDLEAWIEESVVAAAKTVFFVRPLPDVREATARIVPDVNSPFTAEFPAQNLLGDQEITRRDRVPTPIAVNRIEHNENENGVRTPGVEVIFCSLRTSEVRAPLPPQYLADDAPAHIRAANVFYREVVRFQAVDSVFLPDNPASPVQMIVDVGGGNPDDIERARLSLLDGWREAIGAPPIDRRPENLFPAIDAIYEDDTEGKVVLLHFDCPTEVSRQEKVRRSSDEDLRSEAYHQAGVDSVQYITPYRLGVRWDFGEGANIEAHLPSTLSALTAPPPYLDRVEMPRFQTRAQLDWMVQRVLHHAGLA